VSQKSNNLKCHSGPALPNPLVGGAGRLEPESRFLLTKWDRGSMRAFAEAATRRQARDDKQTFETIPLF